MARQSKNESGTSVSKVNTVLLATLVIVVLALVFVVFYYLKNPRIQTNVVQQDATQRDVLITPENVSQIISELKTQNSDAAYTTSMSIDWTFTDGAAVSEDAYVENDVSNSRAVYFDLIVSSTGETVYSSPVIPIGSKLKNIRLTKELAKGDYNAVVVYHLLDDNQRELSTVSVAITLHILN